MRNEKRSRTEEEHGYSIDELKEDCSRSLFYFWKWEVAKLSLDVLWYSNEA